jgi:hypothetical protein
MMEYEAVKQRLEEMRRSVERQRLVDACPARRPRWSLRLAAGTGLARLGVWLAGRTAVRAALGDAW